MPTNRIITVPVRVNDTELDVIDRLARQKGISRSACIRQAALEMAKANGVLPRDHAKKGH